MVAMGVGGAAGKCSGPGVQLLGLILLIAFNRVCYVTSSTISVPSKYTVFQGDLRVSYSISEPLTNKELIEVVRLDDQKVVATTITPRNYSEAELTFECGALDTAGQYAVRLLDRPNGSVIADGGVTHVTWPRVTIELPAEQTILSDDVTLKSSVDDAPRCESARRDTAYELVLVFRGEKESRNETGSALGPAWNGTVEIETRVLGTISMVERTPVTFRCTLFDRVGVYRVILRSNRDRGNPVAISNALVVNDNSAYGLELHQSSVFPCPHPITVNYHQPKCSSQEDKIRLYRLTRVESGGRGNTEALHKLKLDHVTERRINKFRSFTFACSSFSTAEVGYCFRYGAVTQTGSTEERAISCLATTNTSADHIVAEWNSWSAWGPCMGNCRLGTRQRVRSCNNPYPGIKECSGSRHENASCKAICLDEFESWTMAPQCDCGCTLTSPEGAITTSLKCPSLSVWRISAPQGHVVRLEFRAFKLRAENPATWVRILDGDGSVKTPLLKTTGGVLPAAATTTTQKEMIVQFMGTVEKKKNEYGQEDQEGFVAKYTTFEDRSHFLDESLRTGRKQAAWETAVTIIGALLSVAIVVGTVAFICRRQIARRCLGAKLTETPVHEALLGKGTAEVTNHSAPLSDAVLPLDETGSGRKVRSGQRPSSQAELKSRSSISSGFMSGSMTNSGHEQISSSGEALFPIGGHHRSEIPDARASQELKAASSKSRRAHRKSRNEEDGRESFPLDEYPKKLASGGDASHPHEKRPPVEGRDAPALQKTSLDDFSRIDSTTAPEVQSGDFDFKSKPPIVQDVLSRIRYRDANLPDLETLHKQKTRNPEERGDDFEATTPQSDTSSLILPQKDPANQDLDFITNDEFEYDDYIPELPGSYLTMDQPGYTLTWSKHHL